MSDSATESCFQSEVLGQEQKNSSFFSVPGLFIGFNTKGLSDSESARSPTSPLDCRMFSNLGNPIRSPRSFHEGAQKSWDCSKVGLGIVDSLHDETKATGKVLGLSKSGNILFGSQLRMIIPSSQTHLYGSIDSLPMPNSLPKNYAISPNTQIKSPRFQLGSSEKIYGAGEIQSEPKPLEKIQSFLSDSGKSASSQTSLTYLNTSLSSEDFWADKETTAMVSPPLIGGGLDFDNSLGMKLSSSPITIGSGHGFMEPLSASEIELSEDYTCVISHGPNPRTTHIFGDCILECHTSDLANFSKKEEQGIEVKCLDGSVPDVSDGFLSFCYSCKKKLEEGEDIYIYRFAPNILVSLLHSPHVFFNRGFDGCIYSMGKLY